MRMSDDDFKARTRAALGEKPGLSAEAEHGLFARAEELLAVRRERLHSSEVVAIRKAQSQTRRFAALRRIFSSIPEVLAIHPDAPATVVTFAALMLAFLTFQNGRSGPQSQPLSYADLPSLPKNNDVPARYDAQRFAEQQAYEREVEDAHQKTSGGI
jgi:hypothetical protein